MRTSGREKAWQAGLKMLRVDLNICLKIAVDLTKTVENERTRTLAEGVRKGLLIIRNLSSFAGDFFHFSI